MTVDNPDAVTAPEEKTPVKTDKTRRNLLDESTCSRPMTRSEIKFQEKVKSTKFALAVGVVAIITTLVTKGVITPSIFSDIIQLVVGAYILGDVAQNSFVKSRWSK